MTEEEALLSCLALIMFIEICDIPSNSYFTINRYVKSEAFPFGFKAGIEYSF
jgi:hypothetical protein